MDLLSDDFQNLLYAREWAVKIDASESQPYLIKSFSSKIDASCGVVITDTKSVWTEVLPSQHFARRWRKCNLLPMVSDASFDLAENDWRAHNIEVLANAHTPGCIQDLDFEIVETKFSDLACTIEGASFQWRWETNYIGHRESAEFISKHLILPLISLSNLAFISPGLADMTDDDIEKSVDKVARVSKRTPDIYVKNVLSKPRISSTLARLTAAVNRSSGFPPVNSEYDIPELQTLPPPKDDEVKYVPPEVPQKGSPMADVQFNVRVLALQFHDAPIKMTLSLLHQLYMSRLTRPHRRMRSLAHPEQRQRQSLRYLICLPPFPGKILTLKMKTLMMRFRHHLLPRQWTPRENPRHPHLCQSQSLRLRLPLPRGLPQGVGRQRRLLPQTNRLQCRNHHPRKPSRLRRLEIATVTRLQW